MEYNWKHRNCFSCCFRSVHHIETLESLNLEETHHQHHRSPCNWIKSECKILISKIGRNRRQSTDFKYDPLSYALNFDEGGYDNDDIDEFPLKNFASRLPASPPPPPPVKESSTAAIKFSAFS